MVIVYFMFVESLIICSEQSAPKYPSTHVHKPVELLHVPLLEQEFM